MLNAKQIGDNIENRRIQLNLTITELRKRLGTPEKPFSHSQYYRIKNGEQLPSLAVLDKLKHALKVDIDWLLYNEEV